MAKHAHWCAAALTAAGILLAAATSALACACCTHTAWRYVETEKITPQRLSELEQFRFAKAAKLMLGEADDNGIKGVQDASEDYQLTVTRAKGRMAFAFRDEKGRSGTLVLAMPSAISIFEVDPRGKEKEGGLGPSLYKEWKLTANAIGTGMFAPGVGSGQRITLILQGRGNNCSGGDMFSHWTLAVFGPKAEYHLFGAFKQQ
jgi:hypothetical protein